MRVRLKVVVTFLLLTVGALVMLAVAMLTLFQARRFYSEVIASAIGRVVLALWGIRFVTRHSGPLSRCQTVFVSNHDSTLDVFLLIALALPRTRFFLSGFLRKTVPIGIIGTLIRIIWTVPQEYPDQRRRIFQRAERILRQTGDSVYLSPEGRRVTTGEIGHFNKGSFHLATSLRAPIVPMYFHTPREINPGLGVDAKPGLVTIYFLPAIDTSDWRVEDVEANRDRVRDLYVRVHASMRASRGLPEDVQLAPLASREPASVS